MRINNLLTIYCQHFWKGPVHTGSVHTGPFHTGPVHTGSVHTGTVHTGPVHTGLVHTGPVYTGSKKYSKVQTFSLHNLGQNNVYDPCTMIVLRSD